MLSLSLSNSKVNSKNNNSSSSSSMKRKLPQSALRKNENAASRVPHSASGKHHQQQVAVHSLSLMTLLVAYGVFSSATQVCSFTPTQQKALMRSSQQVSINPNRVGEEASFSQQQIMPRHRLHHRRPTTIATRLPALHSQTNSRDDQDDDDEEDNVNNNKEDEEDDETIDYDGLYEFLTRRAEDGSAERHRKRDRLRAWMNNPPSSESSASSSRYDESPPVQPVGQDGSVIKDENDNSNKTPSSSFENFFQGMPSLDDILSPSSPTSSDNNDSATSDNTKNSLQSLLEEDDEDNWFHEELTEIENFYAEILEELKSQIANQRSDNPASIPDNAEAIVTSIVKQELQSEILDVCDETSVPASGSANADDSDDDDDDVNQVATRLLESLVSEGWNTNEDTSLPQPDSSELSQPKIPPPKDGSIDDWALERMEEMLEKTQRDDDETSTLVSEYLEQQVDDLRQRMELESRQGSIHPQTMKEWQMYLSFSSKLKKSQGSTISPSGSTTTPILSQSKADDETISGQLDDWKAYLAKEEATRALVGLSTTQHNSHASEWHEKEPPPSATVPKEEKSEHETICDLNDQAIKALEQLASSGDNSRAKKTARELARLKTEMANNANNPPVEEEVPVDLPPQPLDLSDTFLRHSSPNAEKPATDYASARNEIERLNDEESLPPPVIESVDTSAEDSSSTDDSGSELESDSSLPPPPTTPFFSDDTLGKDEVADRRDGKLGSLEEQKLQRMYRRANVSSKDEQDAIKSQWEAFNELESSLRTDAGLSSDEDADSIDSMDLKYDVSEVLLENGDFDAETILSRIGPRPSRSTGGTTNSSVQSRAQERSATNLIDSRMDPSPDTSDDDAKQRKESEAVEAVENSADGNANDRSMLQDESEKTTPIQPANEDESEQHNDERKSDSVSKQSVDSMGRSDESEAGINLSDLLGPRSDHDETQEKATEEDSFQDQREKLLKLVELTVADLNSVMEHQDSVYTTFVPQGVSRVNRPFKEFGAIVRLEGVLIDLTGINKDVWTKVAEKYQFRLPSLDEIQRSAVLTPEAAIMEVFFWTTDLLSVPPIAKFYRQSFRERFAEWEEEEGLAETPILTQKVPEKDELVVENFPVTNQPHTPEKSIQSSIPVEQSQLKMTRDVCLDIAREFGLTEPSDEQLSLCSMVSADVAIREILDWSKDPKEINRMITSQLTIANHGQGTSQDFDERGGSLSTMLELQYLVWKKIADEYAFPAPDADMVLAASVLNEPIAAIQDGFAWTDDETLLAKLVQRYDEYLGMKVNEHFHNREYTHPHPATAETQSAETMTQAEGRDPALKAIFRAQIVAWKETADIHNFQSPPPDQIEATVNLAPSDAVRRLLAWTYNFNGDQINSISKTYEEVLLKTCNQKSDSIELPKIENLVAKEDTDESEVSTDEVFQAAFDAWQKVAWLGGYNLPDQQQVEFALSVGPEEAILEVFHWTDSRDLAKQIGVEYLEQIKQKREEWRQKGILTNSEQASSSDAIPTISVRLGGLDWIHSLKQVDMGFGILTCLERDQMESLLQYAKLQDVLPPELRVSASSCYDGPCQQMLGVALRMGRRPDHCVMLDTSPSSALAAAAVEMRTISIVGPYPRYELITSDSCASSLGELTTMDIRRLFGDRIKTEPMVDMQEAEPSFVERTKTDFWDGVQ